MQRRHLRPPRDGATAHRGGRAARPPSLTRRRLTEADERALVGYAKVQAGFPSLRLHVHLEPEVTA